MICCAGLNSVARISASCPRVPEEFFVPSITPSPLTTPTSPRAERAPPGDNRRFLGTTQEVTSPELAPPRLERGDARVPMEPDFCLPAADDDTD